MLEGYAADGTLRHGELNLATITAACAIAYLNFSSRGARLVRDAAKNWSNWSRRCFSDPVFARTEPPWELTRAGNSFLAQALQSPLIVDSLSRREGENNLSSGSLMSTDTRALYTRLPAIDRLLRDPAFCFTARSPWPFANRGASAPDVG